MQTRYLITGDNAEIQCPYCGERIELELDTTTPAQRYIEDCQVCCRPIEISTTTGDSGEIQLIVARDDD